MPRKSTTVSTDKKKDITKVENEVVKIEDKSKQKNHIEFSKLITIIVIGIFTALAIWSIIEYYILVRLAITMGNDILPDSTLPVACITTILGAVLSYCLYQGMLKTSLNKNKLTVDKATNTVRAIMESDIFEAIQDTVDE